MNTNECCCCNCVQDISGRPASLDMTLTDWTIIGIILLHYTIAVFVYYYYNPPEVYDF